MLATQTIVPMGVIVRCPIIAKEMLMQTGGNSCFACIAEFVAVQIRMGCSIDGFAAEAAAPMIVLKEVPVSAKIMLVQGGRNSGFTDVASLIAVQINVRSHIVPFSAKTIVPMFRFVFIPCGGKMMLM